MSIEITSTRHWIRQRGSKAIWDQVAALEEQYNVLDRFRFASRCSISHLEQWMLAIGRAKNMIQSILPVAEDMNPYILATFSPIPPLFLGVGQNYHDPNIKSEEHLVYQLWYGPAPPHFSLINIWASTYKPVRLVTSVVVRDVSQRVMDWMVSHYDLSGAHWIGHPAGESQIRKYDLHLYERDRHET